MADIWVNILGDASKLKGALGNAEGHVSSFSEKVGKIGKIATIAGAAVTGAFTAIMLKTAEVGDKFDKMSLRTGIAVEDLSALAYAADICGSDIETMEKGLKALTTVMDDASRGVGEGMEAFKLLDIAVVDSEGNLRSTVDVFKEAATKISAVEDPTKQLALAMDLFGAKAGPQLLPLLKMGEAGIDDLMAKADELGITISTEAAINAAAFTDSMTDLKGSLAGAGRTIGDVLIPAVIPLIEKVTEIVGKVVAWTKENPELVATITKVVAVVGVAAAVGGPILMLVSAFSAVAPAIALIGTIATGPIGLLIIAVTAIIAIWKNWDKIVEFVSGFVEKIKGFLIDLKDKAVTKVTEMIDWIIEKFEDIAELPAKALQWGKDIITDFVAGIKAFLDEKLGGVISKITGAFDAVKGLIDTVKGWGKSISEALGNGMSEGNPRVDKAMDEVVETIAKPIRSRSPIEHGELSNLHKWGENISGELASGIVDGIPTVETAGDELATAFKDKMIKLHGDVVIETEDMMDNIETAVEDATPDIVDSVETLTDKIEDIFETTVINVIDSIADLTSTIQSELSNALYNVLSGTKTFGEAWTDMWTNIASAVLKKISDVIAEVIFAAACQFLLAMGPIGWIILIGGAIAIWAWINAQSKALGGEIENIANSVKGFQAGGLGTDTALAWFTPGEYVIAKPMTDFIKRSKMIPQSLIDAITTGSPTPIPAFAGGGEVGYGGGGVFFAKGSIDIHDNKISDEVDIKRLAMTVSDEILRKINLNRRH